MNPSSFPRFAIWEGDIYRLDLGAPPGSRVLVKEGNAFVSKPGLGKLFATIDFEGTPIRDGSEDNTPVAV